MVFFLKKKVFESSQLVGSNHPLSLSGHMTLLEVGFLTYKIESLPPVLQGWWKDERRCLAHGRPADYAFFPGPGILKGQERGLTGAFAKLYWT